MDFNLSSASGGVASASHVGSPDVGMSLVGLGQEAENSWSELATRRDAQQEPVAEDASEGRHQLKDVDADTQKAQAAWARPDEVVQPQARPTEAVGQEPSGSVGPSRDLAPPANLSQESDINAKLLQHGTPEMRQKLDNVNDVVRQQYALLEPEVKAGTKAGATKEKQITAANAGSTINHINDAVDNLRRSVAAANTPDELNKAISEYGKQSSMIGGSLGKTVMGASTLGVRQKSLQVAIAGGLGVGIAGIVPGVVSAVNSSRTANNTSGSNGNTSNG